MQALANAEYKRLDENIEQTRAECIKIVERQIAIMDKKMVNHTNQQDEVIDLITCEISKDSKKKSDIIMELESIQEEDKIFKARYKKQHTMIQNKIMELESDGQLRYETFEEILTNMEKQLATTAQ